MAYSTVAQLRNNVTKADSSEITDPNVDDRIAEADKEVEQDLANWIDFTLVPAIGDSPATPDFINKLSQYKTAELVLIKLFGAKRAADEVSDIQYWEKKYSNPDPASGETIGLLERITAGGIPLELSDGTDISKTSNKFTQDSRDNIKPALGLDELGEFESEEDLEDERPID